FGYLPARNEDVTLPHGLSWLLPVIRHGVTPAVLALATAWLVALMARARGRRAQPLSTVLTQRPQLLAFTYPPAAALFAIPLALLPWPAAQLAWVPVVYLPLAVVIWYAFAPL